MSDTTPRDGNPNPDTDASATTPGRHETDPNVFGDAARREADARDAATDAPDATSGAPETGTPAPVAPAAEATTTGAPAASARPTEPVGEPISYDTPDRTAPDRNTTEEYAPAPVSANPVKRETYVPAASVGTGAATLAADDSDAREVERKRAEQIRADQDRTEQFDADQRSAGYPRTTQYDTDPSDAARSDAAPTQAYAPTNTAVTPPVYIQAPTPPKYKGNRGAGLLIALLGTAVFAVLYALVALALSGIGSLSLADTTARFTDFIVLPIFYVPVIFFFAAFAVLIAIVNRGGWWAYVLFGFLVAVVVYFSFIGAALLSAQAWNFTPDEALRFIGQQWLNPGAIAAAVVAREVPIWTGAWIARRGRSVTERNAAAKADYERQLADGPQGIRSN